MFLRRQLPVLVTSVTGIIILLQFFFNIPMLKDLTRDMINWVVILQAFALALGVGNLVKIHGTHVSKKDNNTLYSAALLISLVAWFALGVATTTKSPEYRFWWDNLLLPMQATMYSTTIFFITSAAYRAFRIRNLQSAILLTAAILVMSRVGIGAVVWSGFGPISSWIMNIPNTAGMRGITIGAGMGIIANATRILLGLERGHLGGTD